MKWMRDLYHWVLRWADHRHNTKALAVIATIESIFFPIPVDALLLAMGTSRPKLGIKYAFIATSFSVLGGLAGYALGAIFWEATSQFFFQYVFSEQMFEVVMQKFRENAFGSIFVASFTPIPFKVFTVAGGAAELSLVSFTTAAILGRGMRFFLLGGLFYYFGEKIRSFIEQYFEKLIVGFTILLFLGLAFYKWAF